MHHMSLCNCSIIATMAERFSLAGALATRFISVCQRLKLKLGSDSEVSEILCSERK